MVLEAAMANSAGGRFQYLWLYPRQDHFVRSDDYSTSWEGLKMMLAFFSFSGSGLETEVFSGNFIRPLIILSFRAVKPWLAKNQPLIN